MSLRLKETLIALNAALILFSGVYLFYGSPLRQELESRLADIKTRVLPSGRANDDVVVVAIDDAAIQAFGDKESKDFDYAAMRRLTSMVLERGAKAVAPLLHTQVFPYDAPERATYMQIAFEHPNVFIGVFDLKKPLPIVGDRDNRLERSYAASLVESQWEGVISDAPVFLREQADNMEFLIPAVFSFLAPERAGQLRAEVLAKGTAWGPKRGETVAVRLNYFPFAKIRTISAAALLDPNAQVDFTNKTVVIGYGTFRPNKFRVSEATFLNTPWQNPGDDLAFGVPVTKLMATGLANMLDDSWLRPAPLWVNVLQTLTLGVLAFAIWSTSISLAVLLYGVGFVAVMVLHALARRAWNIELPMADSLFFATLMTFIGGFWRLRKEIHARAVDEAALGVERELARTQERFLNRFSYELSSANQEIARHLTNVGPELPQDKPTLVDILSRASEGSRELEEYLAGIRDLAAALDEKWDRVKLAPVDLLSVSQRVARRFDAKLQDSHQTLSIAVEGNALARTDGVLVEQILHNLLSNANKYSPSGSAISVTVTGDDQHVAVNVKDQGPGIAEEYRERIFEKFYRIPNDQVYKVRGTGVGLFLSRYFANIIGAEILVSSEPGAGSTFSLRIRRGSGR